MANKIILKKSSVASKVPLATDLEIGEIAVNLADQKLYSKNASGTVIKVGDGTATGTVTSITGGSYLTGGTITTSGTLAVDAATAATANKIVARDANGDTSVRYLNSTYVNMSHSAATRSTDTVFYSSTDAYIRKNTAAGFRTSLDVPTNSGTGASGTWGISVTGNAATADSATTAATATNLSGGTCDATTITATTSILPAADNTGVVGTAAATWNNGQFTNLTVDSTLTVRAAIDLADSDVLRMGSSDDWALWYNGSTNKGQIEMEAACLGIQITNNGTEIAYIEKASGQISAKSFNATAGIIENSSTISADYTIASGNNAMSAGPIDIATGVTVTVPTGSTWVIV